MTELRNEFDDLLTSFSKKLLSEIDLASERNKKLLAQLHDQIMNEMDQKVKKSEQIFLDLLEEERKIRAEKDSEQVRQLQTVKVMLLETINTKIESTQALARALVNEEAAERAKEDENILKTLQQQIKALDESLRKLIAISIEELRLEFMAKMRELEIKFEEFKLWTIHELNKLIEDFEEYVNHATAHFHVIELEMRAEAVQTVITLSMKEIQFDYSCFIGSQLPKG